MTLLLNFKMRQVKTLLGDPRSRGAKRSDFVGSN
jgi:hypothetical protein